MQFLFYFFSRLAIVFTIFWGQVCLAYSYLVKSFLFIFGMILSCFLVLGFLASYIKFFPSSILKDTYGYSALLKGIDFLLEKVFHFFVSFGIDISVNSFNFFSFLVFVLIVYFLLFVLIVSTYTFLNKCGKFQVKMVNDLEVRAYEYNEKKLAAYEQYLLSKKVSQSSSTGKYHNFDQNRSTSFGRASKKKSLKSLEQKAKHL